MVLFVMFFTMFLSHHKTNWLTLLLSIGGVFVENNIDLLFINGISQTLSVRLTITEVCSIPKFFLFLNLLFLTLLCEISAFQSTKVNQAFVYWFEFNKHICQHFSLSRIHQQKRSCQRFHFDYFW